MKTVTGVYTYAKIFNTNIIIAEIAKGMKWKVTESYSCIHNYVDLSTDIPIIRKGAISAKKGGN